MRRAPPATLDAATIAAREGIARSVITSIRIKRTEKRRATWRHERSTDPRRLVRIAAAVAAHGAALDSAREEMRKRGAFSRSGIGLVEHAWLDLKPAQEDLYEAVSCFAAHPRRALRLLRSAREAMQACAGLLAFAATKEPGEVE